MDFHEVLKKRRSIRKYSTRSLEHVNWDALYQAVDLAPSACNCQPWRFEVITNAKLREAVCSVYTAAWLREAPGIVVALGNASACWSRLEGTPIIEMDIGIAMEHFVLAATAEGLGTCWICAFDVERMNKALQVASPWSIQAISPLGYPAEEPSERRHRDKNEIFKVVQ